MNNFLAQQNQEQEDEVLFMEEQQSHNNAEQYMIQPQDDIDKYRQQIDQNMKQYKNEALLRSEEFFKSQIIEVQKYSQLLSKKEQELMDLRLNLEHTAQKDVEIQLYLRQSIESKQNQLEYINQQNRNMQDQFQQKVLYLETKLNDQNDQLQQKNQQINKLYSDIISYTTSLIKTQGEKQSQINQNLQLQAYSNTVSQDLESLLDQMSCLRTQINDKQIELEDVKSQYDIVKTENSQLTRINDILIQDIQQLKQNIQDDDQQDPYQEGSHRDYNQILQDDIVNDLNTQCDKRNDQSSQQKDSSYFLNKKDDIQVIKCYTPTYAQNSEIQQLLTEWDDCKDRLQFSEKRLELVEYQNKILRNHKVSNKISSKNINNQSILHVNDNELDRQVNQSDGQCMYSEVLEDYKKKQIQLEQKQQSQYQIYPENNQNLINQNWVENLQKDSKGNSSNQCQKQTQTLKQDKEKSDKLINIKIKPDGSDIKVKFEMYARNGDKYTSKNLNDYSQEIEKQQVGDIINKKNKI